MHETLVLLVDKSAPVPVELHPIRRVLPALYEGLWACDVEQPEILGDGDSIEDTLLVLSGCEVDLWLLYDTIQGSIEDLSATPGPSEGMDFDMLKRLATANRLIKQIHAALSSLPQRRHPGRPKTSRADKKEERSQGVGALSQAWKYVCTGTGGQHNTVQKGSGYQVVTNKQKLHGGARGSGPQVR